MYWDVHQRAAAIVAIGQHAANQREEHDRQLLQKGVETEERSSRRSADCTIQFWAADCVQVPMLDVQAPNHCTRSRDK